MWKTLDKAACDNSVSSGTDGLTSAGSQPMMWHVVFAEPGRLPQSRAARSRDHAIHVACELLSQCFDVRRILEPDGRSIERSELNEHYDQGRFPGLRRLNISRQMAPLVSA
jgi:hypothetical protein